MKTNLVALAVLVCVGPPCVSTSTTNEDISNIYEVKPNRRMKRALIRKETKVWPNAEIPYEKSTTFSASEWKKVQESIDDWQKTTCVKFRLAVSTDKHRVKFVHNPKRCFSQTGMTKTSSQKVYMGHSCSQKDRLQVLGFLLGLEYEVRRPDRDRYISVYWENISPRHKTRFEKYRRDNVDYLGTTYDAESVMHFKKRSDSVNGERTLQSKRTFYWMDEDMGGETISYADVRGVMQLYNCKKKLGCPPRRCLMDGFLGVDCECWCWKKGTIKYCKGGAISEVRKTPPKHQSKKSCFPGDAQLFLDNGETVQMRDLKAGQMVLTVKDGQRLFSEVKTFLKRHPNENSTYITLSTDQANHVSLSADHLIFASTNQSTTMEARLAGLVQPGDYIFSTANCARGVCAERVVQVSLSYKQGIYVPLTDEGTVVVNGMLASCYTTVAHDVAHFFMTPFRWFPWLLTSHQHGGYSPLIPALKALGRLLLPKHVHLEEKNKHILQNIYHPKSGL